MRWRLGFYINESLRNLITTGKGDPNERDEGTDESQMPGGSIHEGGAIKPPRGGHNASLIGKNVVVIGGSRGVGRRVVEAAIGDGARVLAVARQEKRLRQLAREVQGVES